MRIRIDTRQHAGKHNIKNKWFAEHGIETVVQKIDFGDYTLDTDEPTVSIDTKANVDEIAQNLNAKHEVFKRECLRARDANARLIILIENTHGYLTVNDLRKWTNGECLRCQVRKDKLCDPHADGKCTNPRHKKSTRKPIQGPRLALAMNTMSERYGVEWLFCSPYESAPIIVSILKEAANG